jgi:EpsI family protein
MSHTSKRLYVVVGIVVAAITISYLVQAATEPPEVEMPDWTLRSLPMRLGDWRGEPTKLDPQIAAATHADVIVDRLYRDDMGRTASLHTAMFRDPADGVYHSPLNCYNSAGWKLIEETREKVEVADDLTIPVSLTTWEREGDRILVAYWFQLGEHVLYSRADLGVKVRWALRGQPKWPVLVKVMMQTQLNPSDSANSKAVAIGFTRQLAKWVNQPAHRKYLDRWPGT